MGRAKKTQKFAKTKRMINPKDVKAKTDKNKQKHVTGKKETEEIKLREAPQANSNLFFQYNMNLGPPYQVIIDTNFINFAIQNKVDPLKGMMDCLLAKCIPCVTDCVLAELEKMGHKYRLALRLAKDPRFKRLTCCHKGTYADDCLVQRITEHKCYIVATNDKDLKRRIRKIPGVPIMYCANHKFNIERMPDSVSKVPVSGGAAKV
eukprot:GDKI01030274.1.p1 GENE.GDKI01030274.1~~GDKI01030274.1.p1  ORF type:complete len:206 (-),score=67.69 GDKI01030274.1:288-905(-)